VRRCKNHQYEGLLAVPDLRLGRSIRRRRMRETQFDLRRALHNGHRGINCSQVLMSMKERSSQLSGFSVTMVSKKKPNSKEKLWY
jgi:hypothetical protein